MSALDAASSAVGWFALGCICGAIIAGTVLDAYMRRAHQSAMDTYRDAERLLDRTEALRKASPPQAHVETK